MAILYLIPTFIDEEANDSLNPYIKDALKDCEIFFVENERSARRFIKKLVPEIVIDDIEIILATDLSKAKLLLKQKKNIGILSEAGCPGIADPGQEIVRMAQELNVTIKPLVGPNSIILALMASGMNGQHFSFLGYLPIDKHARAKAIKDIESESRKKNLTQIFIETPYRNNQLMEALLQHCDKDTRICIAKNLTGKNEWIRTLTVSEWQKNKPDLPKEPAIFLLYSYDKV